MKLDSDLTFSTKMDSKWIIDLSAKYKTVKLIEDNVGESLDELGIGDDLLDKILKVWTMKEFKSYTSLKLQKSTLSNTQSKE